MRFGVDYAFDRPSSLAALKAEDVDFVGRYLAAGHGGSKELTLPEVRDLSSAHLDIFVVWERTAGRASEGGSIGALDARAAKAQGHDVGMPDDRPIYFAVDYDADPPDVASYFQAANNVLGHSRVGVYGGYRVVRYLLDHGLVSYAWQTLAWSGGRWDSRRHLEQYAIDHTLAGADCDLNHALKPDFGQWRLNWSPAKDNVIRPGEEGPRVKKLVDDLMWLGYLPWPILGRPRSKWGGWVNTALAHFQTHYHVVEKEHGRRVAGPKTQAAIKKARASRARHGYKPRPRVPLPRPR